MDAGQPVVTAFGPLTCNDRGCYDFILDAPPGADGKRRRQWSSGYPTRKAAEQALRAELARRDDGVVLDGSKLTLRAYVDRRFLPYLATIRDPRTVERYGELLRLHVLPALGAFSSRPSPRRT